MFSNESGDATYTSGGVGVAYTNTMMTNSKTAILAGSEGNTEKEHYITYNFKSDERCKGITYWKTNFAIYCEPEGKRDVTDADFTVEKDPEGCMINISVRHPAGCPMINFR